MSKGSWRRPVNKGRYDRNFEAVFGPKKLKVWEDPPFVWTRHFREDRGIVEYICPHGIGHSNGVHGCDGCCDRDDYPGRNEFRTKEEKDA